MQKKDGKVALSRRAFVGKLATGAAGAAVALAAGAKGAEALTRAPWPNGPGGEGDVGGTASRGAEEAERQAKPQAPAPVASSTEVAPDAPPPWELMKPLRKGSAIGHGWRVAELSAVAEGSFVLTLKNVRGREHRVHVCRNDGRPQGLVYTAEMDLVVMNGGRGDLPTEEGLAQAVAEVAHVMAANEGKWRVAPMVTALLPQVERERKFGGAAKLR